MAENASVLSFKSLTSKPCVSLEFDKDRNKSDWPVEKSAGRAFQKSRLLQFNLIE